MSARRAAASDRRGRPTRTPGTEPVPVALLDLQIGRPAHGGHCVARIPGVDGGPGRVVFVRHALPGERVLAKVTETGSRFWRADAVEVLDPSPDRVPSAWPTAGPGGVGGGELAHVRPAAQRAWKSAVLTEQVRRLGGLDLEVPVAAAPSDAAAEARWAAARGAEQDGDVADGGTTHHGDRSGSEHGAPVAAAPDHDGADVPGLGWRTRVSFVADGEGRLGMRRFRSHDVVALDDMPLMSPALAGLDLLDRRWTPGARVDAVAPAGGDQPLVLVDDVPYDLRRGKADHRPNARSTVHEHVTVGERTWRYRVAGAGFWQVHRDAPAVLVGAVLDALTSTLGDPAGATVLDLYSGAGLFTLPLADLVGEDGQVIAVEGDARAIRDARRNAHDRPQVTLHAGDVAGVLERDLGRPPVDAVVLDPPRVGVGRQVVDAVTALAPRTVVYVACDPAALARDLGYLTGAGYTVTDLRGYDLFPMTHHVEAVAVLTR